MNYAINEDPYGDEAKFLRLHLAEIFQTEHLSLFPVMNSRDQQKQTKSTNTMPIDTRLYGMKGFLNNIGNIQNTCYANSLLQILLNQESVVNLCLNTLENQDNLLPCETELLKLINSYKDQSNSSNLSSVEFKSHISNEFKSNQQQDAHHFLLEVYNKFEDTIKILYQFQNRIENYCTNCNNKYDQSLLDINLMITVKDKEYNFENLLDKYSLPVISKIECACKKYLYEKKMFYNICKFLILHFNLFDYSPELQRSLKKRKFNIKNFNENQRIRYGKYFFRAIGAILHHGDSINHGHYSSIILKNNEWIHVTDTIIEPLNVKSLINHQSNCNIYLLFLEKL